MVRSAVTLDHHSRLLALPCHVFLYRLAAFDSAYSHRAQNTIYACKRPLFSHTYKPLLPQPLCIHTDANCRVPTPRHSAVPQCGRISLLIYNKQVRGATETLAKKPLKHHKQAYIPLSLWRQAPPNLRREYPIAVLHWEGDRSEYEENYR